MICTTYCTLTESDSFTSANFLGPRRTRLKVTRMSQMQHEKAGSNDCAGRLDRCLSSSRRQREQLKSGHLGSDDTRRLLQLRSQRRKKISSKEKYVRTGRRTADETGDTYLHVYPPAVSVLWKAVVDVPYTLQRVVQK